MSFPTDGAKRPRVSSWIEALILLGLVTLFGLAVLRQFGTPVAAAAAAETGPPPELVPRATFEVAVPAGPHEPPEWSLPFDRGLVDSERFRQKHWDGSGAIDLFIPTGTPVVAVRGGRVAAVYQDAKRCGIGLTIEGADRERWTYCHASCLFVTEGQRVAAGQLLLHSGATATQAGPHLHLEVRSHQTRRCVQPVLVALAAGDTPPPISSLALCPERTPEEIRDLLLPPGPRRLPRH